MTNAVTREIKINAPPEVVFDYFVDPTKSVRWHATRADLDPRPGGTYVLAVTPGSVVLGEFVEVDPPRRVVFTWGWQGSEQIPPGSTTVDVTLEADGDYTLVRVTHRDLPTDEARAQHAMGWEHYLSRLAVAAPGGDAGPDPWASKRS